MSFNAVSSQAAAVVLFLTQECKLKAPDAIQAAKPFLEAGFDTREKLLTVVSDKAGSSVLEAIGAGNRKKIVNYLKRPAVEAPLPTPKRAKTDGPSAAPQLEAPPPPSPMVAEACTAVIKVNRSPVMILWAAVVAKVGLGYDWQSSLSLASAVAGLNSRAKGISIGMRSAETPLYDPTTDPSSVSGIQLLGREVPARRWPVEGDNATKDAAGAAAVRGVSEEGTSIAPISVHRYLTSAFKDHFDAAYSAFLILAGAFSVEELARKEQGRKAYAVYEDFRPDVAGGAAGWGSKGEFELASVIRMAGVKVGRDKEQQVGDLIRSILTAKPEGETLDELRKLGDPELAQASIDQMQLNGEAYVQVGKLRLL